MKKKRDGTSRGSAPIGPRPSRQLISTPAKSRSTAARTRFRRTSSRKRSSDSDIHIPEPRSGIRDPIQCDDWIPDRSAGKFMQPAYTWLLARPGRWPDTTTKGTGMDFDFTEEQRLLKESVDRFITDRYNFEQRKAFAKNDAG